MSENNPYVARLAEYPEIIYPFYDEKITTAELDKLKEKLATFDKKCIELGSGSGMHIIERARNFPNTLHIGFEIRYKRAFRTAEKSTRHEIKNLIILRTRAENLFEYFDHSSIDRVIINFPDPWEKNRWKKHRLLQKEFLIRLHSILKKEGVFSFKTDHQDYFESVLAELKQLSEYEIHRFSLDLYQSEYLTENIQTEFEKLFISKKLPIYFLEAIAR